jgi:hypothetical protein
MVRSSGGGSSRTTSQRWDDPELLTRAMLAPMEPMTAMTFMTSLFPVLALRYFFWMTPAVSIMWRMWASVMWAGVPRLISS